MASKIKTNWNYVASLLNTAIASGSLTYVKELYEGLREDIPNSADGFPCIILEPASMEEENQQISAGKKIRFNINILCYMFVIDRDKQITGESADSNKGIVDFTEDVKNVLGADTNLGGNCLFFEFSNTQFSIDPTIYPVMRGATITMTITLMATATSR